MSGLSRTVILSLIIAVSCSRFADGARILAVFPTPSFSHQVIYRALTMELARRGHQLVVVTTDPINDPTFPNYTEIDISFFYKARRDAVNLTSFTENQKPFFESLKHAMGMLSKFSEIMLRHEKFQALISANNSNEQFDLIFLEWFGQPCLAALSHRFSAPLIGVISAPVFAAMQDFVGNPNNPSYITNIFLPYTDKKTFFERLDSFIFHLRFNNFFYNQILPMQDEIARRYFGPTIPYIGDMLSQVSMLFMNVIEGFHPPRPNVPSVVYINGFHIKPPKPLPKDIKQFLDNSPKGAIYFSLGSNVKSAELSAEKRNTFLEAFAELTDYHVLWKWEADSLPGQPANVRIIKWAPQQDVLRHPKIKVFITQGGLQSTEEAINAKVPMIGIPFFGDQKLNLNLGEERGISVRLDLEDLNKENLLKALNKIINETRYAENIRKLSALVSDQPSTPMERAVWWTEYVLRHRGAPHLRTAAVDMPWYQYLLLDVALFLLATGLLAAALCWLAARFAWRAAARLLFAPAKHKTS